MPVADSIKNPRVRYSHLSRSERSGIDAGLLWKKSVSEIAEKLNRHNSTIYRELRRNSEYGRIYEGFKADRRYRQRIYSAHTRPALKTEAIRKYVVRKLKKRWSPEQIAGRLTLDHPGMKTNHESIYQFIYRERPDLIDNLPQRRKKRKKRGSGKKNSISIPHRVSITERPKHVEQRRQVGHWEADTMVGKRARSPNICVLTERKTGYLMMNKLETPDSNTMKTVVINRFRTLPPQLRKTITYDNGPENARHYEINRKLSMSSYFCNPYHAWEKGSVENAVGLLRQYWPKKTDIRLISEYRIKQIEQALNTRPRKRLGYKTPSEVFLAERLALDD